MKQFVILHAAFQSKIKVPVALNQLENQQLVCIEWGNSMHDFEGPSYPRCLAIVYQQGYLQLLFNEKDKHPLTANLPIQVIVAKWNPDGTVLAVLAEKAELPSGERSMIYFINGYGEPIHMLKVPAMQARGCSWEKTGLCLAVAADSSIILANIKAEYKVYPHCSSHDDFRYELTYFYSGLFFQTQLSTVLKDLIEGIHASLSGIPS
ncbi:hypothetical protein D918_09371 [Trichuris suis]|nr:hypothetical protein D918_09371 [Trichuris suis]